MALACLALMHRYLVVLAVLLVGILGGMVVKSRAESVRLGYQNRRLIKTQAELRNEVRWLHGEVWRLKATGPLIERARARDVVIGKRWGEERYAPSRDRTRSND